jgi:hypothetical protein
MKHIIEAGTDVATVCFFDPAALPENFNERAKQDPYEAAAEQAKEGRIWSQETGADGGYLFHFYVDEEVPELILKHAVDPKAVPSLLVPSGDIWACGVEYAARDPENETGGLAKFPHMGGRCSVPPGEYAVTVWRMEWLEGMIDKAVAKRIGKRGQRQFDWLTRILGYTFIAFGITTLILILASLSHRARAQHGGQSIVIAWLALIACWMIWWMFMRVSACMERSPVRREVEREFPSILVQMKSTNSGTT